MQSVPGFSGRSGRVPYGVVTLAFAAIVLGLAVMQSDAPFTQLVTSPWTVVGRFLDGLVRVDQPFAVDPVVSLAIFVPLVGGFSIMTARRLRDIGQSPWWTMLVIFSGLVIPVMMVLSVIPSARPSDKERVSPRPLGVQAV